MLFPISNSSIQLLRERGLLDFDLRGVDNGVGLCPTCHVMFDRAADPAFVFIPTDIQFFIVKELQDRQKRRLDQQSGIQSQRRMPSAAEYTQHLRSKAIISPAAESGLYSRVFLQRYLLEEYGGELFECLKTPRHWHGAPFAAFNRAFLL
ncbi:hypothetical protein BDV06DRAFT_69536 [Aspergillus oleicola]